MTPPRRDPDSIADIDAADLLRPDASIDDEAGRFGPQWWRSGLALLAFGGVSALTAYVGARATQKSIDDWYPLLDKPRFTPPNWTFAPVWAGMYTLSAISGYRVWQAPSSRRRTAALALWGAQLVLNGLWSPLFFGRRRPTAALVDLVALGVTATAYAATARGVDRPAAAMVVPYLGWLGFAGALNSAIVRRNPLLAVS